MALNSIQRMAEKIVLKRPDRYYNSELFTPGYFVGGGMKAPYFAPFEPKLKPIPK